MAKKSRRVQSRKAAPQAAAPTQEEARQTDANGKTVDFRTEYHYVITDVRNMAVIAAVMLVVLVGLSFIVQ
jgi:hypothetical protein